MKQIHYIIMTVSLTVMPLAGAVYGQPLHEAVKAGNLAQVDSLINAGTAIDSLSDGLTPLHVAMMSLEDNRPIIESLIDAGADVNAKAKSEDSPTPLHIALSQKGWTLDTERILLARIKVMAKAGTDLDAENSWGLSVRKEGLFAQSRINNNGGFLRNRIVNFLRP